MMTTFWEDIGYFVECGKDGFPDPGKLMKQRRMQLGFSREELAEALGVSRVMVTRMEQANSGLDSVTTRRKLARVLKIAPFALGIVSLDEVKQGKQVFYDTTILQYSLKLHREVYFNGGNVGGVQGMDVMTSEILEISQTLGNRNQQVMGLLCEYCQLGIDVALEEQDYASVHRYGKWALDLARDLEDNILLASTLMRY